MNLPAHDGFYMPAEWEPHARCWIAWPCRMELWGDGYDAACRAFAQVARAISGYEPVRVLARAQDVPTARLQLGRAIEVVPAELDDSWARDILPSFLVDAAGRAAGVAWRFNAWGNKYHGYARDASLSRKLLAGLDLPSYDGPMVLEGGAIHVDGQGTLLAVETAVLNPNRNPTLDRRQVEERLALHLGVRRIVWLEHGLSGDETDGHVDNVACFVAPGRAMACVAADGDHPDRHRLAENLARLKASRDAGGRTLEVLELPLPAEVAAEGRAVPSYLNFYVANGAVVMPGFGDAMDSAAARMVSAAYPNRSVVQIDARAIVRGGGGIHCITREQPLAGAER